MNWIKQMFSRAAELQYRLDSPRPMHGDVMGEPRDCDKTILDLPEDILLLLFQYLPPKDLMR